MDRRKALLALIATIIGVMSGKAKFVYGKEKTIQGDITWAGTENMADFKVSRIIWEIGDIETIEVRMKNEKIEIKTSEIFKALKEGR